MRTDITTAIDELPPLAQKHLQTDSAEALSFLNTHLPATEHLQNIIPAYPSYMPGHAMRSLLAVTERHLIFVAPAPQVVSWKLEEIKGLKAGSRSDKVAIFHFERGDSVWNLGLHGEWVQDFVARVERAMAIATLTYG